MVAGRAIVGWNTDGWGERAGPPPPRLGQVVIDRLRPAVERASVGRSDHVGGGNKRAAGRGGLTTSTRTHIELPRADTGAVALLSSSTTRSVRSICQSHSARRKLILVVIVASSNVTRQRQ